MNNKIRTYSGLLFDPLHPRARRVKLLDIAHALSQQCRFSGHTREFYSVAEHCVRVSNLLEDEHALAGLLHDASEAYCVDVPTPIKYHAKMKGYRAIEKNIERAVGAAFGIDWPLHKRAVKMADLILLNTETRDLMLNGVDSVDPEVQTLDDKIVPWTSAQAKERFLARFFELSPRG